MVVRGRTAQVVAAPLGFGALLATIVPIPGVSHFFGCRPLLPHQWGIARGSAGAATAAAQLWQRHKPASPRPGRHPVTRRPTSTRLRPYHRRDESQGQPDQRHGEQRTAQPTLACGRRLSGGAAAA